jgi:predicted membrane protein
MENQNFQHHSLRRRLVWGGLIIVAGLVLLGRNFGFMPQDLFPVLVSWQMLLIVLGFISIFYARFWNGIILLLVGGFFLVPKLSIAFPAYFDWAGDDFVHVYYPVLLIAGGILLIISWFMPQKHKPYRRKYFGHPHHNYPKYNYNRNENPVNETAISENQENGKRLLNRDVVFSGCDEIYLDEVFYGGQMSVVFGGINLDLRRTSLPEGETFLEINAVFGGVEIYVPDSWLIELHIDTVAGGFSDSRLIDSGKIDTGRKLIITGSFVFGGGDIK